MSRKRIGEIGKQLGLSADTLRYYEKIGLLQKVERSSTGIRLYNHKDISNLKFIQRAQKMKFSLVEISGLLQMRKDPQHARADVRELTQKKLIEVESNLQDLTTLHNELTLLVNLCTGSENGCPIIEGIEEDK